MTGLEENTEVFQEYEDALFLLLVAPNNPQNLCDMFVLRDRFY